MPTQQSQERSSPQFSHSGAPPRSRGVATGREFAGRLGRMLWPTHLDSMHALLAAVDAKDSHTRSHSVNVARYAEGLARRIHLPAARMRTLRTAAMLHDIGKIGVPDRILNKPGPLTEDEFKLMARHPRIAVDILAPIRELVTHRTIVLHHHERYDGSGYPAGLAREDIPIEARILAVADAVDTMLSPRPYKQAFTLDQVRSEISREAGRHFDPYLAGITLSWMEEWEEMPSEPRRPEASPRASRADGSTPAAVAALRH